MVDATITFGFELLQKLYDFEIGKKEDVIVLFVHWHLIKHGFRCIGLGDSKSLNPGEKGSELLPQNWNVHPNYALRYVFKAQLYILHGVKSDEDVLFNLLSVANSSVSNLSLSLGETVYELHGPIEFLMPEYQTVLDKIRHELLDPVLPGYTTENCTQTDWSSERDVPRDNNPDPLRVDPPIRSRYASAREWDPMNVGIGDLNPLARGSPGMLFDPFSPSVRNPLERPRPGLPIPGLPGSGMLPPGAIPPFARFDPFGPPDLNPRMGRPNNPDNDHLSPPGYDDMFM